MLGPVRIGAVEARLVVDPDDIHERTGSRLHLSRAGLARADQDAVVAVVEASDEVVGIAWPNYGDVAADDAHVGPEQGQYVLDLGVGQQAHQVRDHVRRDVPPFQGHVHRLDHFVGES